MGSRLEARQKIYHCAFSSTMGIPLETRVIPNEQAAVPQELRNWIGKKNHFCHVNDVTFCYPNETILQTVRTAKGLVSDAR